MKGRKAMPVMDEFKEERAALKNGTLKQKLSYFWEYYKWHVIITAAVLFFAVSMIVSVVTSKENAFYAAVINGLELESAAEYSAAFMEYAGIDAETCEVLFDTSMHFSADSMDQDTVASSQKLMTYLAAGELDVFVGDDAVISQYAYNETFFDLRTILTAEQLARYESCFYYLDQTILDAVEEARNSPNYDYSAFLRPDPKDPGSMENPVPVGLYLDADSSFLESYYYSGDVILAVPLNSGNLENVSKFIDFLSQ